MKTLNKWFIWFAAGWAVAVALPTAIAILYLTWAVFLDLARGALK